MSSTERTNNGPKATSSGPVELSISISDDGTQAGLSGAVRGQAPPGAVQKAVMALLHEKGVKNGLLAGAIRSAIDLLIRGEAVSNLLVAQGAPAQMGRHARVEVLAPMVNDGIARVDKGGHIAIDLEAPLPLVKPGTKVARVIPPQAGSPGKGVLGEPLPAPDVRHIRLQPGAGVELSPDGMEATALIKGVVYLAEPDRIQVLEAHEIQCGEEGCGLVDLPGLVRINGQMQGKCQVKCHTLIAKSLEPGSQVLAEGDVLVEGGIMGSGIQAGGTLMGRYIRDCTIHCAGEAMVESEVVGSQLNCRKSLELTLPEGRIVNSRIAAIGGVSCGEIISSGASNTVIRIGMDQALEDRMAELRKSYRDLQERQKQLQKEVGDMEVELFGTEAELKEMLSSLKDPGHVQEADNLRGQIDMMKPLRQSLKDDITALKAEIWENFFKMHRISARLDAMRGLANPKTVRLLVRNSAESGTEIIGPGSSLLLNRTEKRFVAKEYLAGEPGSKKMTPIMKLQHLSG